VHFTAAALSGCIQVPSDASRCSFIYVHKHRSSCPPVNSRAQFNGIRDEMNPKSRPGIRCKTTGCRSLVDSATNAHAVSRTRTDASCFRRHSDNVAVSTKAFSEQLKRLEPMPLLKNAGYSFAKLLDRTFPAPPFTRQMPFNA
jgi:hypothetical protein